MPLYEFEHSETKAHKEIFYCMKEAPTIGAAIEVEGQKYIRVPSSGVGGIVDSTKAKTIGDIAAKNTEEMIRRGDTRVKKGSRKVNNPWWRPNKKLDRSLINMSKEQKMRYIYEGKK